MESDFGKLPDGRAAKLFTITNKGGATAEITNYGATLVALIVPDRSGKPDDVVLGFDTFDGYLHNAPFFGATVGRYGNRIAHAAFTLNGVVYKLEPNERGNTLHGGLRGFDKAVWTKSKVDDNSVDLAYLSEDGEEGFPGNLTTHVRYTLTDANEVKIEYTATTDKDTVLSLTNHSYFNLAGQGNGTILDHELTINGDEFTPVNSTLIPTGQIVPVAGTPFDFRTPHKIGERIGADDEQIRFGGGYDHNWVLNSKEGLGLAATVYEPTSGRVMKVWTTEPGVQLYTSNGLNTVGKGRKQYVRHGALCLETQHYPDSPNQPAFPSTVLKAGQTYQSTTVFQFSAREQ